MNSNSDLDAFDSTTSSTSTSRKSTIAARPRNRRLISVNDDEDDDGGQLLTSRPSTTSGLTPPHSRGRTPSPYATQRGSPLPSKHPSRVTETNIGSGYRSDNDFGEGNGFQGISTSQRAGSTFATGLLESSWSSLQSLAFSVLGSNSVRTTSTSGPATMHKRRKPSRSNFPISSSSKQAPPSSWGPLTPATSEIGAGTKEERQALVQAKKREVLLLAKGDSVSDLKGRYKRRDSTERSNPATINSDHDEEALVYVHHVQPTDSMTGVTIRYGCQPAAFRKANGFWPSDSIQTRKIVLLPVEACSVKGRRLQSSQDRDLLGDETSRKDSIEDMNGSSIVPVPVSPAEDKSPGGDADGSTKNDQIWKHEAWVQIEGFPAAVEIGRVLRRTLGFFPRSRRKSQALPYSDAESLLPSFGLPRQPKRTDSPSFSQSPSSSNTSHSPSRSSLPRFSSGAGPSDANPRRGHRRNNSSICLAGPGGVGTLGRDVRTPGPAPDGLNTFFAQRLPNLTALPPPIAHRKTSFDSTSTVLSTTSSTGLENVGGAIEGWVRKMASRAKSGLNELQQNTQAQQGQAVGIGGLGDLIELSDGLEGTTPPFSSVGSREFAGLIKPQSNLRRTSNSQFERFPSPSVTSRTRTSGVGVESGSETERLKGD